MKNKASSGYNYLVGKIWGTGTNSNTENQHVEVNLEEKKKEDDLEIIRDAEEMQDKSNQK